MTMLQVLRVLLLPRLRPLVRNVHFTTYAHLYLVGCEALARQCVAGRSSLCLFAGRGARCRWRSGENISSFVLASVLWLVCRMASWVRRLSVAPLVSRSGRVLVAQGRGTPPLPLLRILAVASRCSDLSRIYSNVTVGSRCAPLVELRFCGRVKTITYVGWHGWLARC